MPIFWWFLAYGILLTAALARAGHRSRAMRATETVPPSCSKILIVGASGGTGRQLVTQALERGYSVTALVRNPSRLQLEHPQLTVVQGDVLDRASVDKAMPGQDAVLSALGHKKFFYPTRILSEGTQNILQSMEAHGVPRFVCETSLGLGNSAGSLGLYSTLFVIPLILPFYFWDKTRQERSIAQSNRDWIIVRPGSLDNASKRGRYRHGLRAGSFLLVPRISRADVAEFMLNQLESDTYLRTAPGVCW